MSTADQPANAASFPDDFYAAAENALNESGHRPTTAAEPPRLVQSSGFWNDNQPWTRQVIVMPVDEATWRRIGEANRAD